MIATESLSLSELVVSEGLRAETQLRSRQGTQQLHLTHYSFCLPFSYSFCLGFFSFFVSITVSISVSVSGLKRQTYDLHTLHRYRKQYSAFDIVCNLYYVKYNIKTKQQIMQREFPREISNSFLLPSLSTKPTPMKQARK